MAIVKIDPEHWQKANSVQVDSDAADNAKAILEIEDWAAENGFARIHEYWLRQIRPKDGRPVFRGICYRLTEEETASSDVWCHSSAQVVGELPLTPHEPKLI